MENITEKRMNRLRETLKDQDFDTLLVLGDDNRRYLSGFTGKDGQFDESAGALFISSTKQLLATDSRYEMQAQKEAPQFEVYCHKRGLAQALPGILEILGTKRLGFESVRLSCLQFEKFKEEFKKWGGSVSLTPTEGLVEGLRMIKDQEELEAIRQSLAISESIFENIRNKLEKGKSEKDLAWSIEKALREKGAEAIAFPTIVAFGANGASPHAIPTDRFIEKGQPLLFDWGCVLKGYCSDISRTIVIGKPDDTFKKVYQVVRDAQSMAIEAIKPGMSTQDIDKIAREHIAANGFGDYFGHGLGHGVGLATHEKPHLSPHKPTNLELGMVTTVEPGIYIPGWGGVRLENMVVVENHGATVLNRLPV